MKTTSNGTRNTWNIVKSIQRYILINNKVIKFTHLQKLKFLIKKLQRYERDERIVVMIGVLLLVNDESFEESIKMMLKFDIKKMRSMAVKAIVNK